MSAPAIEISDRYTIVRELGRGGMATVYLATDTRYHRDVAIKVLNASVSEGILAERFVREIEVAARLTHPHIVPLLDSGATNGRLWFVMPVLDGQSLYERLQSERQLPVSEAVRIAGELASALSYAHARGVVHRDIKSENVLLSNGSAALADFGLAKGLEAGSQSRITTSGMIVGTPLYMSPEQASGEPVDGRSDIYSLGCLLYETLAGEPPYTGNTPHAIIAKRFSDPVPSVRRLRRTVPPEIDAVIAKSLALAPADRYQTSDEFAAALRRAGRRTASQGTIIPTLARGGWRTVVLAAVAVAALIAALVVFRPRTATATHAPRSIAVLPFTNLSDDKSQEYFSAGMTDELLSALSSIRTLRVAARTSSYAMRDTADLESIGRRLRVEAVLKGTVRRDGDAVRVFAQLQSVADGTVIWSRTYDGKLTNVFALQDSLARAIVAAIQLQLGNREVVHKATDDVQAYDLYLKGRHALDTRTAASIAQAAADFKGAVDRDPSYARAWSGLADAYIFRGLNFYGWPLETYPKAEVAAKRAIELDSTLAEAYTSLATVRYLFDRDFAGADAAYKRAIALDPKYPQAHYFYALFLIGSDEARAEREAAIARELDPLSPPMAMAPGMIRVSAGKYADAVPLLRDAIALEPNYYFPHGWLGLALAHAGDTAGAISEAGRAVALNPQNALMLAFLGETYAMTGNPAAAVAMAARIDTISTTRPVCGVYVARIFDRLGDDDRAMAWLQRAQTWHEGQLTQLGWPDGFHHVNADPRFQRLVRQTMASSTTPQRE